MAHSEQSGDAWPQEMFAPAAGVVRAGIVGAGVTGAGIVPTDRPRVSRALDAAAARGVVLVSAAHGWGGRDAVDRWVARRAERVSVIDLETTGDAQSRVLPQPEIPADQVTVIVATPDAIAALVRCDLVRGAEPIDAATLAFDPDEMRRVLVADGWRAGRYDVDAALAVTDGRASAIAALRQGLMVLPIWLRSEFLRDSAADFIGRAHLARADAELSADARLVLTTAAAGELERHIVSRMTGLELPAATAAIAQLDSVGLLLHSGRARPRVATAVAEALRRRLGEAESDAQHARLGQELAAAGGEPERAARQLVLAGDVEAAEVIVAQCGGARSLGSGGVLIVGAHRVDPGRHPWLATARVAELLADGRLGEARRLAAALDTRTAPPRARALSRARIASVARWQALLIGGSASEFPSGLADALRGLLAREWRAVADGVRRAEQTYRGDEPLGRATRMLRLFLTAGVAASARDRAADRLLLEARGCRDADLTWLARLGAGLAEVARGRGRSAVEDALADSDERLALVLALAALAPSLRAGNTAPDRLAAVRASAVGTGAHAVLRFLSALELDAVAVGSTRPTPVLLPDAPVTGSPGSLPVATAEVAVRCFGGFAVTIDGSEVALGGLRPRARTLLRILALHGGAPVHREILAELLWADRDQRSALHNLHVGLSSVRAAIAEVAPGRVEQVLVRRGEAYALCSSTMPISDLARFDAHLRDADRARHAGDLTTTISLLSSALSLYDGDVLPEDGPAEWVVGARERYRLRAAEAASALARFQLDRGDFAGAASAAIRSVDLEPWRDESWRTLMEVHRLSGDGASLERAKQRYRSVVELIGAES